MVKCAKIINVWGMLSEIRRRIIGEKNRIQSIIVIFASNRVEFAQFALVNGQIKVNSVRKVISRTVRISTGGAINGDKFHWKMEEVLIEESFNL